MCYSWGLCWGPVQVRRYAGPSLWCSNPYCHTRCCQLLLATKHTRLLATETNYNCACLFSALLCSAGKMIGDKRATMAEKRFNRPLKRVLVGNAGVMN